MRHRRSPLAAAAVALLALAAACGGSSSTPPVAPPQVQVSVVPSAVSLPPLGTSSFSAAVTGTTSTAVTWSVLEGPPGGTVTAGGAYTAPAGTGQFHVAATSVADPSRSGSALVTVSATPVVVVSIDPTTATVPAGGAADFTCTVTGSSDTACTWSVTETGGGTVSASGHYLSPPTAGTYHVVARSHADAGKSATATVTVTAVVPPATGWLTVAGNQIRTSDGSPWHGRGANLADTRGCNACAYNAPSSAEVMRRVDELVDSWHGNFIRLDLESYAAADGRVTWAGILSDPAYLADIQGIVAHAAAKPGVYVMVSLWVDPTFTALGWPTTATNLEWAKLADVFKDEPRVLYGLVNEPQSNFDGAQDAQVWAAMNSAVQTIRDVETAAGTPHHIVAVQGTRAWSRVLDYYLTHPITAGGGVNVAYETHVYDPASQFAALFENPSATLPVIIGEFGPVSGSMTLADTAALMASAEAHGIPYLAWTFHMRCSPDLLVDNSNGGCGVGMTLTPTTWGAQLKARLATPW